LEQRLCNVEKYSKELSNWAGLCKKAITELGGRVKSRRKVRSAITVSD
jgi:hypothetical protein